MLTCVSCSRGLTWLDAHEGRVRLLQGGKSIREAKAAGRMTPPPLSSRIGKDRTQ
jgi:hypothetical protein